MKQSFLARAFLAVRSTLFHLSFYVATGIACVLCLPGLLLPKRLAMGIVKIFVYMVYGLERAILGLDYEVRGLEHLPRGGSFIVAAKHQSAYETMKLNIIFNDPAIVLKRELLRIPLWGWFLAKIEPIGIDRKQGSSAMAQIIKGALRIREQGRPIVIFPQGTRVHPRQTARDRPYRIGVARMHEQTGLPVVPMALNTGLYWPKGGWLIPRGKVVFEFLPPLPEGMGVYEIVRTLEQQLETRSAALMEEAAREYGIDLPARLPAPAPGPETEESLPQRPA